MSGQLGLHSFPSLRSVYSLQSEAKRKRGERSEPSDSVAPALCPRPFFIHVARSLMDLNHYLTTLRLFKDLEDGFIRVKGHSRGRGAPSSLPTLRPLRLQLR